MTSEQSNLFNLVQFDRDYLRPVTSHLGVTRSNYWKTLRFSELLTGYLWLQLGIDVGYFPQEESASALTQRYGRFLGSFDEDFKTFGYMLHEPFGGMASAAMARPFALQLGPDRVNAEPAMRAAFQSALNLEIRMLQTQSAENIVGVLNFAPDLLDEVMTLGLPVEIASEPSVDQSAIVTGFGEVVSYMEALIGLSALIVVEPSLDLVEREALERRIRQINRWRVNRFRPETEDQFLAAGKFVSKLSDLDFSAIHPRLIMLLDNWGFTHKVRRLQAGASG